MIYKILLVHRKQKIEQWSTKYYWYTENERLNTDLQNTTGTENERLNDLQNTTGTEY